jgi:hypothetical protein
MDTMIFWLAFEGIVFVPNVDGAPFKHIKTSACIYLATPS